MYFVVTTRKFVMGMPSLAKSRTLKTTLFTTQATAWQHKAALCQHIDLENCVAIFSLLVT